MAEEKIIVTITGQDKTGIVAKVATTLWENGVNIEDIKQTIMQDYFVMIMLCSITNSKESFSTIKERLTMAAESMSMAIWIQRKEIFDRMHTI
ncbi:MAG: ACT domain-containing protein [Candidatus Gastranaerophilales bacterium]|nr:ACT domain-containing protein [Candidatus Gastranaerophilales bacterium]